MIEVRDATKRYGSTVAVDGLSFRAQPGSVTGFLGPNGAGKSTTMRLVLGLDAPDAGAALVGGRRYATLRHPLRRVGALLDATAVNPGLSAYAHLRALARSNRIPAARVASVLEQVGLAGVARRRIGGFSLGMKQRVGIAAALLGDPEVLMFDEPVNGLDPDGVRWIRELLRGMAGQGRTVLISSHLMTEMALTADRLVVIARGRLIADETVRGLTDRYARGVRVNSPRAGELAEVLRAAGAEVVDEPDGALVVGGLDQAGIGDLAAARGIALHGMTVRTASLEEAYLRLTGDGVDYRGVDYRGVDPRGVDHRGRAAV